MKKYIQYNAAQYANPGPEVIQRSRPPKAPTDPPPRQDCHGIVLDLSGKPSSNNTFTRANGQTFNNEQEGALDLSSYGKQLGQDEALDLSKPSTPRSHDTWSQSRPPSHPIYQSQGLLQTPKSSSQSRSPIGQYSLLQAALNSNQSNVTFHSGFDQNSQSRSMTPESRSKIFGAALGMTENSRSIRPFASVPSSIGRPLGISVPHMALSNTSVAVVQGVHKPIAITTPQPHSSAVTTKSQNIRRSTPNESNPIQSMTTSKGQGHTTNQSDFMKHFPPGKLVGQSATGVHSAFMKDKELVERFLINTAEGKNPMMGGQNYYPMEVPGFPCNQCPKVFKTKAAMKLHTTVHKTSEERQYGCTICQRRFLHRHHLIVHQRKHSGEKPFKCDACSKTFMAIFLLHKHLRKHVRENSPKSQISTLQLQQLHITKLANDGVKHRYGSRANLSCPVLINNEPVIVLDDDEDLADVTKEIVYESDIDKKILLDSNKHPILSSVVNGEDMKIKLDENTQEISDIKTGFTKTVSSSNINIAEDSKNVKLEIDMNVTKCDLTFKKEIKEEINQISNEITENTEQKPTFDVVKYEESKTDEVDNIMAEQNIEIKEEEASTEINIVYPDITSDEELELDFSSGEFKVTLKSKEENVSNEIENVGWEKETLDVDESVEIDGKAKINKNEETKSDVTPNNYQEKEIGNDYVLSPKEVTTEILNELVNKVSNAPNTDKDNFDVQNQETIAELCLIDQQENKTLITSDNQHGLAKHERKNQETDSKTHSDSQSKTKEAKHETGLEDISKSDNYNETVNRVRLDKERKRTSTENIDIKKIKVKKLQDISCADSQRDKLTDLKPVVILTDEDQISNYTENTPINVTNYMEKHQKRKKKCKKAKCEVCSRMFHSNHHLILHMAVHKKNPILQLLNKAKTNKLKVLGYTGKSSYNCDICKKVFKFQKSLNSHMRVHSEKLKQQKMLSKAFRDFMIEATPPTLGGRTLERSQSMIGTSSESQNNHSQIEEKPRSESVDCKTCLLTETEIVSEIIENEQKDFERPVLYNEDMDQDPPIQYIIGKDNVKRYVCHACDNTYTTKQKLRMHALIHKDNCFLCDICGKSFFRQVTLDKHLATHKLPRPHICAQCKKSFIHRSSLMRHKVVHEKPAMPCLKQQVADVNFELKMLDTYTLLKQERLQKLQMSKMKELKLETHLGNCEQTTELKSDILDLSVHVKVEDINEPPVLSPVRMPKTPNKNQISPANLSPPLIIPETKLIDQPLHINTFKEELDQPNFPKYNTYLSPTDIVAKLDKRTRQISNSDSDNFGPMSDDSQTFHKKSRKTRVYQTSCRVCKEQFPNVMSLKSHMSTHNSVETHLYECHICHHRFTQSCSLLRHLKTSCQENRLKCMPCGKTFHRRNTFDQHMRLHMGNDDPPNLDGSFYDKRKDEAEIKEEAIKTESDIENNNIKTGTINSTDIIPEMPANNGLTSIDTFNMKSYTAKANLQFTNEDSNDSTDSDARTYLYSEGEVRTNHLSDFSDSETSPPASPKKEMQMPLPSTSAAAENPMLNLLSAVCSDIRNAEKEQELWKQEQEERQKELETIEILTNLKRGALKSKGLEEVKQTHSPIVKSDANAKLSVSDLGQEKNVITKDFEKGQTNPLSFTNHQLAHQEKIKLKNKMHENIDCQLTKTPPLKLEPKTVAASSSLNQPDKLPTVVLEMNAETERRHQEKLAKTIPQTVHESIPAEQAATRNLLYELSQMHLHNPMIQDRLSLLMKAQVPMSRPFRSLSTGDPKISNFYPLSLPSSESMVTSSLATSTVNSSTSSENNKTFKTQKYKNYTKDSNSTQNCPQDLSMKSRESRENEKQIFPEKIMSPVIKQNSRDSRDSPLPSTSSAGIVPPPLVPVFRCELCGRLIYNETDFQIHMREHELSPESASRYILQMAPQHHTHHYGNKGHRSSLVKGTPDMTNTSPKPVSVHPPATLDLSMKKSWHVKKPNHKLRLPKPSVPYQPTSVPVPHPYNPTMTTTMTSASAVMSASPVTSHNNETHDSSSSLASSDLSDTLPSPTTSTSSTTAAIANLDILRKELRNKIYARRRSQGLEDLTVEFKLPEPTEMTEDEKLKLNYRRECNRQAAQRSRMRKKDLVDTLLEELHKEEVVNSDLRRQMENLSAEKISILKVLDSHACTKDKIGKGERTPDKNDDKK